MGRIYTSTRFGYRGSAVAAGTAGEPPSVSAGLARVGVEAAAGLLAEVAGGDELLEHLRRREVLLPKPSWSTRMTSRQTSRPMKSASSSGPIGWFSPTLAPASMSSAVPDALLVGAHRLGKERHQDAVDDEARAGPPRR